MTNGERPYDLHPGNPKKPVVVVSGFMGTGKSTVGKTLARILGLRFVDTDAEIEKEQKRSIAEIFEAEGESNFREIEKTYCMSLTGAEGVVIATGGGSLLDGEVFEMLSGLGQIVLLEASPEILSGRIGLTNTRPLINTGNDAETATDLRKQILTLLNERADVYGKIELKCDTSNTTSLEAAHEIAARIDIPFFTLETSLTLPVSASPSGANDMTGLGRTETARVDIGRGLLSQLGERLNRFHIGTEVFFVMPENIRDLFGEQLGASLDRAGIAHKTVTLRDGDTEKNLGQAEQIIDEIIASGARRDATIVPVGGGVTGDLGGFVAAVYMRGVPLVHVPTTLLAQVDSSVGGKVGINHGIAKNLIGSFYQPHAVLTDPCALLTLPQAELSNGMAEVVKSAIIGSKEFFEYLEGRMSEPREERFRDINFLETCVVESVRIKTRIVNQDPFEKNIRRTLNLGHTVGHAIEASSCYTDVKHGQAVALGTVAALRIAANRNGIDADLVARVTALLEWCGLPTTLDHIERDNLRESIRLDKKIKNRKIHYVLPIELGKAIVVDDVTEEEIFSTLEKGMS